VVTGTHTVPYSVETDEMIKDEDGKKIKKLEWKKETVQQYGFEVRFSAENLNDTPIRLHARAGLFNREFQIPGKTTQTNLTLKAAQGSDLLISIGSQFKSYPITY